jgi:NTP pyrophosphatase (non-canonical NTP hydrolase)
MLKKIINRGKIEPRSKRLMYKAVDIPTNELVCKLEEFDTRQDRIHANKVKHGFNLENKYQEARYIIEEAAELLHALEKNDMDNMMEELADIVIFAYGLAEISGCGRLDDYIAKKMDINEKREYVKKEDGDFKKLK